MRPFVHRFQTEHNNYVYDVNSNRVFRVSDVTSAIIDEFPDADPLELAQKHTEFSKRGIKKSYKELCRNHERQGLFSSFRPKGMTYPVNKSDRSLLKNQPQEQLILNVTEKCNLRCRYCAYSGLYPGQRTHSERDMSFATARKAVDNFMGKMSEKACLSFYGGEPLLKMDLIRETIEYIESRTEKKVSYSMTTNGTLLTPDTADYFIEKDFMLMVSLDGPREIHDRYRVYGNGSGSFDRIIGNLEHLRSLNENYYRKKVTFSVVSAPPHRLKEVNDFFSSEPLVKGNTISFSYMNAAIRNFKYSMTQKQAELATEERVSLLNKFQACIAGKKDRDPFLTSCFEDDYLRFYHRAKEPLPEMIGLNGCCIPGTRRLFVTVDGTLHVCERMDHAYPIGDVDKWIDNDLVNKLINDYKNMSTDCLKCWACRLCSACFAQLAVGGRFDRGFREKECHATRKRLHRMLVQYYRVLEQDDTAWDYMKDISLE